MFQYIKKNLKRQYIRLSNARNSVEMLWVPKKGTSELRLCQHYGVQTVKPNYTGTDTHTATGSGYRMLIFCQYLAATNQQQLSVTREATQPITHTSIPKKVLTWYAKFDIEKLLSYPCTRIRHSQDCSDVASAPTNVHGMPFELQQKAPAYLPNFHRTSNRETARQKHDYTPRRCLDIRNEISGIEPVMQRRRKGIMRRRIKDKRREKRHRDRNHDSDKTLRDWPVPRTVTELCALISRGNERHERSHIESEPVIRIDWKYTEMDTTTRCVYICHGSYLPLQWDQKRRLQSCLSDKS